MAYEQRLRTIAPLGPQQQSFRIPRELYEVQYPPRPATLLCHIFPQADVPVVQLSIDETRPASFHYEVGRLFPRRGLRPLFRNLFRR